jgi:cytochrome c553
MMRSMILAALATPVLPSAGFAADLSAGKAAADRQCVECHEAADWQGEDASSLESLIRDIVAGKVKHKRALQLSDDDTRNIAAYWASGGKKK